MDVAQTISLPEKTVADEKAPGAERALVDERVTLEGRTAAEEVFDAEKTGDGGSLYGYYPERPLCLLCFSWDCSEAIGRSARGSHYLCAWTPHTLASVLRESSLGSEKDGLAETTD